MSETAISIKGVKKKYRLGQIGGGTLQGDLQSWWARKRGKEDPNTKIGTDQRLIGQEFMALNGIDLEIKQGEAIGIIGKNGAGKSTLLKLLSRVTAPSEGTIDIYGRITSMLEVGTGFHPEMTGRENVYMNGAILGMTKKEIDAKMEQIIEFSEVREFIDTPVKRYSSGMYVKLAFSVAAHLDSEIMIMDEVLAVGDMKFQQKCLNKMRDAATTEGKTVLYVSHNMNTIRQLCDRCIVLSEGKVVFDGDVDEAINIYLGDVKERNNYNDFSIRKKDEYITGLIKIKSLSVSYVDNMIQFGEHFIFDMAFKSYSKLDKLYFRFTIMQLDRTAIATGTSEVLQVEENCEYQFQCKMDISQVAPGEYMFSIVAFEPDGTGKQVRHDYIPHAVSFLIYTKNQLLNFNWNHKAWGNQVIPDITMQRMKDV